ncbi:hypothetical protein [Streptomyces sp. NPDC006551]|uniref:hypothetical protein n=1 Tax=Streptomyces sp. NPDC006551 TaxID=3157178 RepID=UPI0033BEFCAF
MGTELRFVVCPPDQRRSEAGAPRRHDRRRGAGPAELWDFLDQHGLEPEEIVLDNPAVIEWRGGGPGVWRPQTDG